MYLLFCLASFELLLDVCCRLCFHNQEQCLVSEQEQCLVYVDFIYTQIYQYEIWEIAVSNSIVDFWYVRMCYEYIPCVESGYTPRYDSQIHL